MSTNNKKILCKNIISNKECMYNKTCLYAHSLDEQKMIPIRKYLYSMIKFGSNLETIDLIKNDNLLKELIILTKVCLSCQRNECAGGYNCRYGAISEKYRVCYDDLYYGQCSRPLCNSVHLTLRGFVPYMKQVKLHTQQIQPSYIQLSSLNKNTVWNQLPKSIYDKPVVQPQQHALTSLESLESLKYDIGGSHYEGIKLTDDYLKKRYSSSQSLTSSEDENETSEFLEYLNRDSEEDSSSSESIFCV